MQYTKTSMNIRKNVFKNKSIKNKNYENRLVKRTEYLEN